MISKSKIGDDNKPIGTGPSLSVQPSVQGIQIIASSQLQNKLFKKQLQNKLSKKNNYKINLDNLFHDYMPVPYTFNIHHGTLLIHHH